MEIVATYYIDFLTECVNLKNKKLNRFESLAKRVPLVINPLKNWFDALSHDQVWGLPANNCSSTSM